VATNSLSQDTFSQDTFILDLIITGEWILEKSPSAEALCATFPSQPITDIYLTTIDLSFWDSSLPITLLQLAAWCEKHKIKLHLEKCPQELQQLLQLAQAIPPYYLGRCVCSH
jgi:phospholipid/cholesterol/gamma-HCH transport system permease protein